MNWDAIGAVSDALAAVGMFITLGFLIFQIRMLRREAISTFRRTRKERARELFQAQATSEWLNKVVAKLMLASGGKRSPFVEELITDGRMADEEALAVVAQMQAWWMFNSQQIAEIDELPPGERQEFDNNVRAGFRSGPMARWYELSRPMLDPHASAYIDTLLAQRSKDASSQAPDGAA